MVPPSSHRVSRVRRYSGYGWLSRPFVYGAITRYGAPSHALQLELNIPYAVQTPKVLLLSVWPLPLSLATTDGISVDVFSSPYLDVSVQAVPLVYLLIQYTIPYGGFPHSDISGSMLICSSPKLFAAYLVLHRLLMPRHSPCALCSLTMCSLLGLSIFCLSFDKHYLFSLL